MTMTVEPDMPHLARQPGTWGSVEVARCRTRTTCKVPITAALRCGAPARYTVFKAFGGRLIDRVDTCPACLEQACANRLA